MFKPIDFPALAQALLDRAHTLVPSWFPAGYEKGGRWYIGDLDGSAGKSCNINLNTGTWIDNGTNEKGGDLISLYAAKRGIEMGEAARELMDDLGMTRQREAAPVRTSEQPAGQPSRPEPPPQEAPATQQKGARKSMWRAILPVPPHAPAPPPASAFKHFHHGPPDHTWEYRYEGQLQGYVCRFDKPPSEKRPNGGKEVLPLTWCVDESDGRGTQKWHWKTWEDPKPLYIPATILAADTRLVPVVVVEGEKCALAGLQLLGHEYDFVSWPGGGRAWDKADWHLLAGRIVYLWPDCDAQHERLSAAEKAAGVDRTTKPIMPEHKQPGMQTMVGIGTLLAANHGCTVYMCPVPKPGAVSEGWDIADAIASGWDAETVRAFIRGATTFVPPNDEARAKAVSTPSPAGAGDDEDQVHAWRRKLLTTDKGAIKPVRENAVLALDGLPGLPGAQDAQGVIAYNEFTNDVVKLKDSPWGTPAGLWAEVDELLMGEWLVREHWLPSMPRGTLEEAIRMVAYRHRYHPVRSWLTSLKWDGQKRLHTWVRRACLEEDEWDDNDPLQRYLARVGTWFLTGMCGRVMEPGFKFDYMLILEGPQGRLKSTLLRTLAGDWFADTGLVLGDKDSYQQLQGRWLYEFGELDSLGKADVTKIKSFIASSSDYFRASFDRRARDYPRQVVFGGTTNEDHYLTDPTGNRRFWPVRVTRRIDIPWVIEEREQLFAEAMVRYQERRRTFPTEQEERELFEPQQRARAVENAIESAAYRYLYENAEGLLEDKFTLVTLLGKLGIGIEKLGPGRYHEKQASAALRRLGWEDKKSSQPGRPMVWLRPSAAASAKAAASAATINSPTQDNSHEGTDDAIPF